MTFDPQAIIAALDRHGVRYVIVGGVAARLHGSPTLTEDVDVTAKRTTENLTRLAAARAEPGLGGVVGRLERPLDEGGARTQQRMGFAGRRHAAISRTPNSNRRARS